MKRLRRFAVESDSEQDETVVSSSEIKQAEQEAHFSQQQFRLEQHRAALRDHVGFFQ